MASKMIFEITVRLAVRPTSSVETAESVQERLEMIAEERLNRCTDDDFYTVLDVDSKLLDVE